MSAPKRYLVVFKESATANQIAAFKQGAAKNVLGGSNSDVKEINSVIMKGFSATMSPEDVSQFQSLTDDSPVDYIEEDKTYSINLA